MPLPSLNRLPLRFERGKMQKEGKTFFSHHFTIVSAPSPARQTAELSAGSLRGDKVDAAISLHQHSRFAILLSKKTAKLATDRNFIKRRTFSLISPNLSLFPTADYLVIPKRSVLNLPYPTLQSDFLFLISKLK